MELILNKINELKKLCETHHVSELHAFGSVTTEQFTEKSDIDFLVCFEWIEPLDYFDNFLDLKDSLSKLFARKVDLLEKKSIRNPILRESVDRNKVLLYGREDTKVAV